MGKVPSIDMLKNVPPVRRLSMVAVRLDREAYALSRLTGVREMRGHMIQ